MSASKLFRLETDLLQHFIIAFHKNIIIKGEDFAQS